MFNRFVLMVALSPCKSHGYFLFIDWLGQYCPGRYWAILPRAIFINSEGNIYPAAKLPCKQIAKSEEDLLDLYLCDLFQNRDIVYNISDGKR